ncbi:hypothetical protein FA95DRAFT_1613036 [Auriscalpium vulgare]|uniref:Uncharacterized protein n=1 Tax=Auriscalpium vulgare TaxID=40419 RepID=A0ACB8R4Q4_9AGAM|nr:hypothetical protein FA95DRAFT_1613036 [Auriscalpium vulgare]
MYLRLTLCLRRYASARRDINDILTLLAANRAQAQRRDAVKLLTAIARRAIDELD